MDWEMDEVEGSFVQQLVAMGWRYIAGDLDQSARTDRTGFKEVIQEAVLRRQLRGSF
ncbi:hypothetical protein AAKU55_005923 [Oxalobacteraceae bacterium GrIS 1.11]